MRQTQARKGAPGPAGGSRGRSNAAARGERPISKQGFSLFCRLLYERHLVTGVGGNASVRAGKGIFITPSGYSLRDVRPEVVVTVDQDGGVLDGGSPTKDVEMHVGILRARRDVRVVCHVHGAFIIALSTLVEPGPDTLPPLTPGFAYYAHPLPMIPFMVPGSAELADAVIEHFAKGRGRAVLLQNHGLVTLGEDFQEAVNIAEEVDEAARIYLMTRGKAGAIVSGDLERIKGGLSGP